jgi:predicted methyltransferase
MLRILVILLKAILAPRWRVVFKTAAVPYRPILAPAVSAMFEAPFGGFVIFRWVADRRRARGAITTVEPLAMSQRLADTAMPLPGQRICPVTQTQISFVLPCVLALTLAACGQSETPDAAEDSAPETAAAEAETVMEVAPYDASTLTAAVEGPWRSDAARARDGARHPAETLAFFEIDPGATVVEVWPGGGWYTDIIAPWLAANGGQYIAAWPPVAADNEAARSFQARFLSRFDDEMFGGVQLVEFGPAGEGFSEAESVDAIVTFRNIHSMMRRGFAEQAFEQFHTALRPGGVLGVVTHRQPAGAVQDPRASTGYVQQDYVIALAEEAGLNFIAASEINANPADTADHPFGVWTLPPVLRTAPVGEAADPEFDSAPYIAIGESDRMTLLFRKPETSDAAAEDAE